MKKRIIATALLTGAMALAQPEVTVQQHAKHLAEQAAESGHTNFIYSTTQGPSESAAMKMVLSDVTMSRFMEGKLVKNAPYSAEGVTETTQMLSDGNRISRKNTVMLYRDSQGRTRRDETINSVGPWSTAGEPFRTTFINDPVSGTHYVLNAKSKSAQKMTVTSTYSVTGDTAAERSQLEAAHLKKVEAEKASGDVKSESLGKQTIEGIVCEGTRTTFTIPGGTIGNDLPINIISERWYSPDLQLTVMSRNSDPRTGETIYKLTSISRAEPLSSLFQVPDDYTTTSGPQKEMIRVRRPQE